MPFSQAILDTPAAARKRLIEDLDTLLGDTLPTVLSAELANMLLLRYNDAKSAVYDIVHIIAEERR